MMQWINKYIRKFSGVEKKGFSLVELIIVMSIMAILVGITSSLVLPYIDKANQAKDKQIYHSLLVDLTSAISECGQHLSDKKDVDITKLSDGMSEEGWKQVAVLFSEYRNGYVTKTFFEKNLKSKEAKKEEYKVEFSYIQAEGVIKVYLHGHGDEETDTQYYEVTRE